MEVNEKSEFSRGMMVDTLNCSSASEDDSQQSDQFEEQSVAEGMNKLPDEMLEMILLEVDSLSRKHAERVCKRWCRVIRRSIKMQKYVKIDLSFLSQRRDRYEYEDQEVWEKECQCLEKLFTPNREIVHLTDHSNPYEPWVPGNDQPSSYFPRLWELICSLNSELPVKQLVLILDHLAVEKMDLDEIDSDYCRADGLLTYVILNKVRIQFGKGIVRSVDSCKVKYLPGESTSGWLLRGLFGVLKEETGPLSKDEYCSLWHVCRVLSQSHAQRSRYDSEHKLKSFGLVESGDVDWQALGRNIGVCPLAARLLIAMEDELGVLSKNETNEEQKND